MERNTKELTTAIGNAVESIDSLLNTLRHEILVEPPRQAALRLQVLAEAAARYAVIARVHAAQLTTLMCMQEAANAEYTGEEKA